ncbi:hypothetical protein, partial [Streptomyces sp. 900105245]
VDFWHAVEFSRNGRFLCTHPLGLSSGLPFGVSDSIRSFRSDFLGAFQVLAFAFPFPAVPTLSEVLGRFDQPLISENREDASSYVGSDFLEAR